MNRLAKQPADPAHAQLLTSLSSLRRVEGLTHEFYRYPARFSPEFARNVIASYSEAGDSILDPFMGGGTTIVEALVSGRKALGIDLNPIATFVARVKSTPLSAKELDSVRRLIDRLQRTDARLRDVTVSESTISLFYNVPWWIRNSAVRILEEMRTGCGPKAQALARCVLLKTAQWALDSKEAVPTSREFLHAFYKNVLGMCQQMETYSSALRSVGISSPRQALRQRRILSRPVHHVETDRRIPEGWLPFKLVVTSPPYPGMHVLYHRWQVRGRRETPAPFAIVGQHDGQSPAYYTMGDRRRVDDYFNSLTLAYRSIAKLLAPSSLVFQLVSFANPSRDIGRFLNAMDSAGYEESGAKEVGLGQADRLWRLVPNRKWYLRYKNGLEPTKEVLLLHRLKTGLRPQ